MLILFTNYFVLFLNLFIFSTLIINQGQISVCPLVGEGSQFKEQRSVKVRP